MSELGQCYDDPMTALKEIGGKIDALAQESRERSQESRKRSDKIRDEVLKNREELAVHSVRIQNLEIKVDKNSELAAKEQTELLKRLQEGKSHWTRYTVSTVVAAVVAAISAALAMR